MMDKYLDIKSKLKEYAERDDAIRAVVSIGSYTRKDIKADEFSDLDLIIATKEPEKWFSGEFPELLGNVSISFIEPTLGGGKERRCIYDNDRDVDMIIFTPEQFEAAIKEGVAGWVMNRGYQVLYDEDDFEGLIKEHVKLEHSHPEMSEAEFVNSVNDFYFHNIWAYKKLKRGEIWSAKMCVDAYLKNHLLKMIELYCYKARKADVWHDGRFIDRWAGEEILSQLTECFAHYDSEDILEALRATSALYEKVTREIAEESGFEYPEKACSCAKNYISL